jgi:hypothetical protein
MIRLRNHIKSITRSTIVIKIAYTIAGLDIPMGGKCPSITNIDACRHTSLGILIIYDGIMENTSDGAYKQAVEGLMREPVTILYLPPLEVGFTDP